MPIHIITPEDLSSEKFKSLVEPCIFFVHHNPVFSIPSEFEEKYNDLLRRFSYKDNPKPFALRGSYYSENFRKLIMRRNEALREMRMWWEASKTMDVYLVDEKPHLPDVSILLDIIRRMRDVWA